MLNSWCSQPDPLIVIGQSAVEPLPHRGNALRMPVGIDLCGVLPPWVQPSAAILRAHCDILLPALLPDLLDLQKQAQACRTCLTSASSRALSWQQKLAAVSMQNHLSWIQEQHIFVYACICSKWPMSVWLYGRQSTMPFLKRMHARHACLQATCKGPCLQWRLLGTAVAWRPEKEPAASLTSKVPCTDSLPLLLCNQIFSLGLAPPVAGTDLMANQHSCHEGYCA